MLQSTFQHTPGIGPKIEQRLWASGVLDWTSAGERPPACLSSAQTNALARCLDLSARALEDGNPRFFTGLLPAGLHWRLFPEFRGSAVYLDIETTGMDAWGAEITTIALYDGRTIQTFVQGRNLADFPDAVDAYDLIVTYNGKCFDVPFIENYFHIRIDHAHIDLRYVLKRLGYAGGLKRCEKAMGIDRGHLDGVDGFFAVLLWQAYREEEDPRVLETLLAYNVEDVVNLEALMVDAYNQNIMGTPYASTHRIPPPQAPEIPFRADARIIEAVRRRIFP